MNFSTARSSSAVVMPGLTIPETIFMQRAWTAPAAAIFSICAGVFRWIMQRTAGPWDSRTLFEAES